MEAAGLALGVVGAIGYLFEGCIAGYRVFSTARNLGRDSERVVCKIRIEEMRLSVWGRECGVVDGKFEEYLSIVAYEGLRDVAQDILRQLLLIILDCHKLQEKYGLREEAPGSVDQQAYSDFKSEADIVVQERDGVVQPTPPLRSRLKRGVKLKARWVIADKEKFENFLKELEWFNDRLEKLFSRDRIANLQRTWTNELLDTAQRDLTNLNLLEQTAANRYPGLSALAQLKQLRINLDTQEPSRKILSSSQLKILSHRLTLYDNAEKSNEARRSTAIYKGPPDPAKGHSVSENIPVLIDWVYFEPESDMDTRLHLYQRMDNLARMLHSCTRRHPDLHTLDCIGYTEDLKRNRYGVVHNGPISLPMDLLSGIEQHRSLAQLIDDPSKRTPDLDVRFRLAKTLAIALWSIHSLDWLHKSFSSPNIIFFATSKNDAAEQHDLQTPYVVGFDSSRPDGLLEMTAESKFVEGQDLYRHPSSLGVWRQTYRKSFDIYSLGLVLLEIGLWKNIRAVYKPRYTHTIFKDKVLQGLVPALGSKTGGVYRSIVEWCLTFDEMEMGERDGIGKGMTPHQMMEKVVSTLESLRV